MKLIVCDLDGTLLKSDKTISSYTCKVIHELKKQGHLFMFATARPIRTVKNVLPVLNEDIACYHNGAIIYKDDKLLCEYGIDHPIHIIHSILEVYPKAQISLEANEHITCNYDSTIIWPTVPFTYTKDFKDIDIKKATKILIVLENSSEAKNYEAFIGDDLHIEVTENLAMIISKKASKLEAIKNVCDKLQLSLDDVISFGDDYNDIKMLVGSKIGVAMKNGLESVKEIANDICQDNDHDGVAHWLNDYFKLGVLDE